MALAPQCWIRACIVILSIKCITRRRPCLPCIANRRRVCREFGRRYAAVEEFMLDDADYVFIMTNSFASMGKAEIKRLRAQAKKLGWRGCACSGLFHMMNCSVFYAAAKASR